MLQVGEEASKPGCVRWRCPRYTGVLGGAFGTDPKPGKCQEVSGRSGQHLRRGDDALAVPVQGWHEFSEEMKPKLSGALLKPSSEWHVAFLVRGAQEHGGLINVSFVVNRVQDPWRLV